MGVVASMKSDVSRNAVPVDKKRSLSMLMTLGMMLANGARADARDSRERVRRQLERVAGAGRQVDSPRQVSSGPVRSSST
jgi:hypothetical protein